RRSRVRRSRAGDRRPGRRCRRTARCDRAGHTRSPRRRSRRDSSTRATTRRCRRRGSAGCSGGARRRRGGRRRTQQPRSSAAWRAHSTRCTRAASGVSAMVSSRGARLGTLAIAVPAGVNLAIGIWLAWRDPSRASDLATIYAWTRGWIVEGARHYTGVHDAVDYPPNALVVLSPLGLLPRPLIVPVWIAAGVALAAVLPYLAVRCAPPRAGLALLPTLLFWCWTSTRTLLQFTPLSLALALASALAADTRWRSSGVLLGLALFKPHIAGPFALWAL